MLRHSASQIFGSRHPALTRASANDDRTPPPAWMWGVGSGRSRAVAQQQQQQELPRVQTRAQDGATAVPASPTLADPSLVFAPAGPPAMPPPPPTMTMTTNTAIPPFGTPPSSTQAPAGRREREEEDTAALAMALAAAHNDRDASSLHPVFFTSRLRPRPSPFCALEVAAVTSPVALGYVYHEKQRRADGAVIIPAML